MSRARKIARIVWFAFFMFTNGCVLGPSEIGAPRSYFLNPEISWKNPHGYGERIGTTVLLITQPKAQAGFETARMAYLLRPYEINYFAVNQWADSPARMFHRIMAENLDKTGLWGAVLQTPGTVPAQYRLDSDNLVLEQEFFSRPSRVRLALRAQIIDTRKPTILATQYFEVFELAASDDPYGGVLAANHAAEKLLIDMAEWLSGVLPESK
jgi:cholesterol transport system auxiliary component